MPPSSIDIHIVAPEPFGCDSDALCFDRLLSGLKVPKEAQAYLWLRLEPLGRLDVLMQGHIKAKTFGLFVTWRPKSVTRHLVDTMVLVDEPTCQVLRRVCHARGVRLVDNSCLAHVPELACAG